MRMSQLASATLATAATFVVGTLLVRAVRPFVFCTPCAVFVCLGLGSVVYDWAWG